MKIALPGVALAMSVSAHATPVTFSTTGFFTCVACVGSGTNVVTFGNGANTVTLDFVGAPATHKNLNAQDSFFSNAHGGNIVTTDSAGEQASDTAIAVNATFHLQINQASPSANPSFGVLTANVEGNIADDFGNAAVQFPVGQTSLVLGGITYNLQQQMHTDNDNLPGYDLESPGGGEGSTTLQMGLQATALPEPTFLALTGVGFAGLSVLAYRRRKKA